MKLLMQTLCILSTYFFLPAGLTTPANGKAASDFTALSLTGQVITLADLKGKVVVLNFWGSWCEPCRNETPDLVAVQRQFSGKGVVILGAAMAHGDEAAIKTFARKYHINYPILVARSKLLHDYSVMVAPTTVIIDRKGNLVHRQVKAISREDLSHRLDALVETVKR